MKTRTLVFGEPDDKTAAERYELIYQGFVTGGNADPRKGMEVIRREAKILDKLESIGVMPDATTPCETCGRDSGGLVTPKLKKGKQAVQLDQPEYDLMRKYLEATPWTVKMSRKIVDLVDWLAAAPYTKDK